VAPSSAGGLRSGPTGTTRGTAFNAVLAYAIEHQTEAKRLLAGYHHLPPDDVDDVYQEILTRIINTSPPKATNPRGYWNVCLRNAVASYFRWRRIPATLPDWGIEDPLQNPERAVIHSEEMREVWEAATPAQKRAIVSRLNGEPNTLKVRVAITRLKERLGRRIWDPAETCKSGHRWTPTSMRTASRGGRSCRPCFNIKARERWHRRRRVAAAA
jgi:DNA-directed RNA polymerase specialized sigma24 family protein